MTINGMENANKGTAKGKTPISDQKQIRGPRASSSKRQLPESRSRAQSKASNFSQRTNAKPSQRPPSSKTRESVATQNFSGESNSGYRKSKSKKDAESKRAPHRNPSKPHPTRQGHNPSQSSLLSTRTRRSDHSGRSWFSRGSEKQYDSTCILRLPRKIRTEIWRLTSLQDTLQLRQSCKTIKGDIDNFVGVRAELDENSESFDYMIKIGIRKAIIVNVMNTRKEILRHPELLEELWVAGSIRSNLFTRLIKDCVNITLLSIQFGKELFTLKPKLFPIDMSKGAPRVLRRLKTIRIQSLTKGELELKYVTYNFTGLIHSHLLTEVHLHEISVSIIHRIAHDLIDVCSQALSVLVCSNCECLRDLRMEVKFQHGPNAGGEEPPGAKEHSDMLGTGSMAHFSIRDMCASPRHPEWTELKNLEQLYFSSNAAEFFCYWEAIMPHINSLKILYLEIANPFSWTYYKKFIMGCEETLESVILDGVEYQSANPLVAKLLDLDLSIFSKCKHLETLSMSQAKHPTLKSSKVLNIAKLPRSLRVIQFAWLSLSTCQAYRLFRLSQMTQLRLAYWSLTDSSFGRFLWLLSWGYSLRCTSLKELVIVDLKIRFQNNKNRVTSLLEHKKLQGTYSDYNETQLVLNTT